MKLRLGALILCTMFALSCSEPTGLALEDRASTVGLVDGVNGRVVWADFEGGFWMIETSDGRRLDPHETLPPAFRTQGLRVHVAARPLANVGCFHMAGIIVEIIEIRAR